MKKIYILTGPKNSGKSTRLLNWVQQQINVIGIVCPREKGKRELYSIHSRSYREFEVEHESKPVVKIGKFKFLQESFDWAEQELLKSIEINPHWVVIDEIGPLELQGKGFTNVTKKLFSSPELKETKLMLVVRDSLVDEVIQYFKFEKENIEIVDFI